MAMSSRRPNPRNEQRLRDTPFQPSKEPKSTPKSTPEMTAPRYFSFMESTASTSRGERTPYRMERVASMQAASSSQTLISLPTIGEHSPLL